MATGICPKCGHQHTNVECYWPRASGYVRREDAPPNPPSTTTTTAKPGDPTLWTYPGMLPQTWEVTTTTTTTYKRKRRHYRREVY